MPVFEAIHRVINLCKEESVKLDCHSFCSSLLFLLRALQTPAQSRKSVASANAETVDSAGKI